MLKIPNNSDVAVIVLHEIYGINEHIIGVCNELSKSGYNVICPDMLKLKRSFDYSQECQAYTYFKENIGLDGAARQVREIIRQLRPKYRKLVILGYSVGATTAWLCSGDEVAADGIIGYYGSRIRDHLGIMPACPTLLIMAGEEKSFDIEEILPELKRKKMVQLHVMNGKHGFADPFSKNYDERLYMEAWGLVGNFLKVFEG